jgi:hypothetical protein
MTSLDDIIPHGLYCYSLLGEVSEHNTPKQRTCPYWSLKSPGVGECKLVGDDDDDNGYGLLWDQVKDCRINISFDEEEMDE